MPRATAADAAATGRRVLDAALHHFAAHGYSRTSLDAVARTAGVTRGAVYHHYNGKPALFAAAAQRLHAQVGDAVAAAADAAGPSPRDQLAAGSHAFLDAITADGAARVLLTDGPAALGWAAWRALDEAHSGTHLREALAAAGVGPDLCGALAVQLSGAMNDAALWLSERPGDAAARTAAHRALDRLLAAALA